MLRSGPLKMNLKLLLKCHQKDNYTHAGKVHYHLPKDMTPHRFLNVAQNITKFHFDCCTTSWDLLRTHYTIHKTDPNMNYIQIRFSLSATWSHVWVAEVQNHSFLTLALDWGEQSTSRARWFNSRVGHSQSGCCGEDKNFLILPEFNPQTVQPQAYPVHKLQYSTSSTFIKTTFFQ
jgi:hypothetical protein